jgi:hypothetical protein
MQQLGGGIGLAVIASVYASQSVPQRFVPGFEPALLTCSGFALLSTLAALFLVPTRRRTDRQQRGAAPNTPELIVTAPAVS